MNIIILGVRIIEDSDNRGSDNRGCTVYVCSRKKYLNRTLEIDSPFQTLTVGLLVEFID